MVYVHFEGAAEGLEQQLITWIRWAVRQGGVPEGIELDASVELDLRLELGSFQRYQKQIAQWIERAEGKPFKEQIAQWGKPLESKPLTQVTRLYGLPVRIGEGLRPREIVLACAYPIDPAARAPGRTLTGRQSEG